MHKGDYLKTRKFRRFLLRLEFDITMASIYEVFLQIWRLWHNTEPIKLVWLAPAVELKFDANIVEKIMSKIDRENE